MSEKVLRSATIAMMLITVLATLVWFVWVRGYVDALVAWVEKKHSRNDS